MGRTKAGQIDEHDFYCIRCGQRTIPLSRKVSACKEKFHRKKLYCPWCKLTLNCVEVRNEQERKEFLEAFQKGEFKDEAEESMRVGGGSRIWEEFMR